MARLGTFSWLLAPGNRTAALGTGGVPSFPGSRAGERALPALWICLGYCRHLGFGAGSISPPSHAPLRPPGLGEPFAAAAFPPECRHGLAKTTPVGWAMPRVSCSEGVPVAALRAAAPCGGAELGAHVSAACSGVLHLAACCGMAYFSALLRPRLPELQGPQGLCSVAARSPVVTFLALGDTKVQLCAGGAWC